MDPTKPPPEGTIRMVLDFDPKSQELACNAPLQNRMLCYAMLKLGEKALDEYYEKLKVAGGIVPIHGNGEELLRNLRR